MKNKDYKRYKNCRFCYSKNVEEVINLGKVPLAGGFLINKNLFINEKKYPLILNFCKECYLLQVNISINPDTLFRNYFYFSSTIKTLVNHFNENAIIFYKSFKLKNKFIVEIGCNDGSFLKAMNGNGVKVLGVDPAKNVIEKSVAKDIPIINDYFNSKVADRILRKYGKADLIFSSNTLAHIEDMHTVFSGISNLLNDNGTLVFEVHYLPTLLKELQYDMIYHEHQYYYSLLCLDNFLSKFGLYIYDAKKIPIHAGSIQIYANRNNKTIKTAYFKKLIKEERKIEVDKIKTYRTFNTKVENNKIVLNEKLKKLKAKNASIMGYGASGRGTIITNYCKINQKIMPYVIDDAPAKINAFMPGTHQKIISSSILDSDKKPDYVLLFAWSFANEIVSKNKNYLSHGGKFIIPLPNPKIINK